MNMQSNAITDSKVATQAAAAVDISAARRFYWSVRRELWEYRSLYVAPVAVAAVILISVLFSVVRLPVRLHGISGSDPMHQHNVIEQPYLMTALFLMGVTLVVAIFYCLDALQGERRDRSILFWKSLPVSDLTTVLAKASIPIVILPLITFAVTAATQGMIFALSTVRLVGSGDGGLLWSHVPLLQMWAMEFYHLLVFHGLWYAPFFGWLLLASAWSRRAALLWAVLPPFAIGMLEKLAFNTTHFAFMLKHHFVGMSGEAPPKQVHMMMDLLMPISPSQLVVSPGFWIGLAITAVFLAAAVRLRRYREPN